VASFSGQKKIEQDDEDIHSRTFRRAGVFRRNRFALDQSFDGASQPWGGPGASRADGAAQQKLMLKISVIRMVL
jgi:hypothetical protein